MPKKIENKTKKANKPINKKKARLVRPDKFMEIMNRLELIDQEIKKQEELFDIKVKSLELEKQYLRNMLQAKKAKFKISIDKADNKNKK